MKKSLVVILAVVAVYCLVELITPKWDHHRASIEKWEGYKTSVKQSCNYTAKTDTLIVFEGSAHCKAAISFDYDNWSEMQSCVFFTRENSKLPIVNSEREYVAISDEITNLIGEGSLAVMCRGNNPLI